MAGFLAMAARAEAPAHPDSPVIAIRPFSVPGSPGVLGGEAVLEDLESWLRVRYPGCRVRVEERKDVAVVWRGGAEDEVSGLASSLVPVVTPAWREIIVVYVPVYRHGPMGRAWWFPNRTGFVVMNGERLKRFTSGRAMFERERRLLRHEVVHAMGLVQKDDHLLRISGDHCTDPRCLMHGRIRLIDLLGFFLPMEFARRQPRELCALCLRDLPRP